MKKAIYVVVIVSLMLQLTSCDETQAPSTGQSTLPPSSILPSETITPTQAPEVSVSPLESPKPSWKPEPNLSPYIVIEPSANEITDIYSSPEVTKNKNITPSPEAKKEENIKPSEIHEPYPSVIYPHDNEDIVDMIKEALRSEEDIKVSNELITCFFNYYFNNEFEIRYLPGFGEGESPNWDDLTYYICMMSDMNDNGLVTAESFDNTIKRYFANDLCYMPKSTVMVNYNEDGYTLLYFESLHKVFYRLTDISRDQNDVYTAGFDTFLFYDDEMGEPSDSEDIMSKNMKSIYKESNGVKLLSEKEVYGLILKIFLEKDYLEKFNLSGHLEIKFIISDNDTNAFKYLACSEESY
jgi:hypothetical protein